MEKIEQEVEYNGRVFGSNGLCPSCMTKGKVKFFKEKAQKRLPKMKFSMNTTPLENGWITGKQNKLLSCTNLSNEKDSVLDVTFSHILQVDDSTSVSVNN